MFDIVVIALRPDSVDAAFQPGSFGNLAVLIDGRRGQVAVAVHIVDTINRTVVFVAVKAGRIAGARRSALWQLNSVICH